MFSSLFEFGVKPPYPHQPPRHDKIYRSLQTFQSIADQMPTVYGINYSDLEDETWVRLSSEQYDPKLGPVLKTAGLGVYPNTYFYLPGHNRLLAISKGNAQQEILKLLFATLIKNVNGNQVELDSINTDRFLTKDFFWNEYWTGYCSHIQSIYRRKIHPMVARCIQTIIKEEGLDRLTLADLFGGNGEFFLKLAPAIEKANLTDYRLHLVDGNALAIRQAKENPQLKNSKIVIHEPKILQKAEDIPEEFPEKLDIVTALGGICAEVVTTSTANEITKGVFNSLKPGGHFIVTGYSPCLLNAGRFQRIGFNVLNMSVPQNLETSHRPQQLYILQKPK